MVVVRVQGPPGNRIRHGVLGAGRSVRVLCNMHRGGLKSLDN
jgi:hypothetical protein